MLKCLWIYVYRMTTSQEKKENIHKANLNLRKIEKIITGRLTKPHILRYRLRILRRVESQNRKALPFFSNYLDRIIPLSTLPATSNSKEGILESVIGGIKIIGVILLHLAENNNLRVLKEENLDLFTLSVILITISYYFSKYGSVTIKIFISYSRERSS